MTDQHPETKLIRQTVKETLLLLGIDACDPTEMQRDFAYLRRWRTSSEKIGVGAKLALIGTACTAVLSVVGLGVGYLIRGSW